MVEFSFDFTEGSFLQLNGQKHLRSVAEDWIIIIIIISKKELNKFIKNGEGRDIIKLSSQYFSTGHNFLLLFTRRVKIKITRWRRHPNSCQEITLILWPKFFKQEFVVKSNRKLAKSFQKSGSLI